MKKNCFFSRAHGCTRPSRLAQIRFFCFAKPTIHSIVGLLVALAACTALPSRAGAQLIETVAGNGGLGYAGDSGPATNSELNNPFGVAVDARGNVYIADDNNQRIRVVNTGSNPITVANVTIAPGDIATVAGDGTAGYAGDGGPAINAELNNPSGVAVDKNGNIYIADLYNFLVRKVNASGIISTVVGNGSGAFSGDGGPAINAGLYPYAVAVDAAGNLYIADTSNERIRAVNMGSTTIAVAGISILPGYIMTVAGNGIQGSSGNGVAAGSAELFYPYGLGLDSRGNIYISDTYNREMRVVNTGTTAITVATITIQPGNIATVAGNGNYGGIGDGGPATQAEFADPDGVAVDSAGNIYVSDLESERIRFINNSTGITSTLTASAGVYGYNGDNIPASTALLTYPRCITVDGSGNVYFADQPNQRIREIVVNSGSFTNMASTAFTIGTPETFAITTDDEPTPPISQSGSLPTGITFVDQGNGIGILSGTPAAGTAGTYNPIFTASNGVFPSAVQNFTLTVYQPGQVPVASSATFLSKDTTTQGNWPGVYGADGYSLPNVSSQVIPTYASLAIANQDNYTWDTTTTDPRGLEIPNSSNRIASAWYSDVSFNFDVNVGSASHEFSIYALDWDLKGRSETIQILDQKTGAPLDTETISNFGSGVYLSWNITGHVEIVVTVAGGANSVVNGVFFGGAGGGTTGSGGANAFVTSYTQGEIRNNYSGWIGMSFTVGATPLNVSSLGRICVAGDSQTHTIEIVSALTGTAVPGTTLQLNVSGCVAGQFVYGSLPNSVTLAGNGTYYLVTQEVFEGDYWYDNRPITTTSDAVVNNGIYSPDGVTWIPNGTGSTSYGPPNFQYTLGQAAPISVTVQTNIAGASFSVDGTTYTSSQTLSWAAGSLHTIGTTSPQSGGAGGAQLAWSNWSDGGAITHTVSPGSATSFTASFTTQYLLTTMVSPAGGGTIAANPTSTTGYYNSATQVQLTAAPNPVCTFTGWSGGLGSQNPVTVTMSGPNTATANFQCNGSPETNFLTGYVLSGQILRNNFSGWVGMKVTAGANPLSVSWVGRICVAGNSGTHTVEFVNASTGTVVPGGSAVVNLSGCSPGQFVYSALASSITLQANTPYYLVSQEVNGGDQWYDHGGISSTSDATVNNSIYSYDGVNWIGVDTTNTSYVPPNFLYGVVLPVPVSVTVRANIAGPSFSVDGTSYTSSQTFSWTAGSLHTIGTTSPQSAGAGGGEYVWNTWSDGGAISHTVSPGSSTTFTANFATQYLLSTSASPSGGGSIAASPPSTTGYYNSGTQVQLTATPNSVCTFTNWGGGLGTANPLTVTMSAATTVTANFQCSTASTNFLTGYALTQPILRNNFSGWVGMKFTVGVSPLLVSSVGRICVAGNSGTHTVEFVIASTGTVLPGGSAAVNMSGCSANQFQYTSLASSVTLQPNTQYYLVSQEVNGGDQWYDYGGITTTSAAAVSSSIYSVAGTSWTPAGPVNSSYVPLDFQYWTGQANATLITAYTLNNGPVRNNFSGWVGMEFTVGVNSLPVKALGRLFLLGNSGTHVVKLVLASNGSDVPGGSVTISMSGGTPGVFSFVPLPSPITLSPNTTYYLVSEETGGGDQWYDYGGITTTTAVTANDSVYFYNGQWNLTGGPNTSYVPPNLE
jgi:Divergent InlB B-repeat domain/NHL repeat